MKRCKLIAVWALVFSQPLFCKAEVKFQFTDLGTLGGNSSAGFAINNPGLVVGASNLAGDPSYTGFWRPFLNDGTMHNLGTLGGTPSIAHAINDHGVIVGESSTANGQRAFLYDGAMHDLHILGHLGAYEATVATAINDAGQVVGNLSRSTTLHAFLYDGTMHDLTPNFPSNTFAQAVAINNVGDVLINSSFGPYLYRPGIGTLDYRDIMDPLGEWQVFTVAGMNDAGIIVGGCAHQDVIKHAFIYDGMMHDLGVLNPSTVSNILFDVNSRGDAVGYAVSYGWGAFGTTVIYSPLFYSKETGLVDLNTLVEPGFALAQAVAINDAGQITGTTYNGHAFLLTPLVPEPNGATAIAIGLTAIVGCRRSRSRRATIFERDR